MRNVIFALPLLLLTACGKEEEHVKNIDCPGDSSAQDTAVDTGTTDPADTADTSGDDTADTSLPVDTGADTSAPTDTGATDTGTSDTGSSGTDTSAG